MAVFELTARHQMYLGAGNQINKGERLTMNIHTMGVQPYIFLIQVTGILKEFQINSPNH